MPDNTSVAAWYRENWMNLAPLKCKDVTSVMYLGQLHKAQMPLFETTHPGRSDLQSGSVPLGSDFGPPGYQLSVRSDTTREGAPKSGGDEDSSTSKGCIRGEGGGRSVSDNTSCPSEGAYGINARTDSVANSTQGDYLGTHWDLGELVCESKSNFSSAVSFDNIQSDPLHSGTTTLTTNRSDFYMSVDTVSVNVADFDIRHSVTSSMALEKRASSVKKATSCRGSSVVRSSVSDSLLDRGDKDVLNYTSSGLAAESNLRVVHGSSDVDSWKNCLTTPYNSTESLPSETVPQHSGDGASSYCSVAETARESTEPECTPGAFNISSPESISASENLCQGNILTEMVSLKRDGARISSSADQMKDVRKSVGLKGRGYRNTNISKENSVIGRRGNESSEVGLGIPPTAELGRELSVAKLGCRPPTQIITVPELHSFAVAVSYIESPALFYVHILNEDIIQLDVLLEEVRNHLIFRYI